MKIVMHPTMRLTVAPSDDEGTEGLAYIRLPTYVSLTIGQVCAFSQLLFLYASREQLVALREAIGDCLQDPRMLPRLPG